ncbi:MAG: hypothetical protein QM802_20095 [Agriterribacter sp.]
MQQMFPELSPTERIRAMRDNADKVEETQYYVPLSQEALDSKRELLTDNLIKVSQMEDELAEIKSGFKLKIDPLKTANKTLLTEVKTRQELKEGQLFHFANHVDSMMETYDDQGLQVSSRRLRPDEKQTTILHQIRPAAGQ